MATFTDIVRKQRAKGEGIGSSLATAFSERARERLDPRNYLFNRKGTLAALFPGLKGYQSKTGAEKLKGSGESGGLGAGSESILNTIADRLGELKTQFRMVAKNSIVLPQMARDANITRQNIQKLVKMQGGEASNKADMFFKRAGERESQYESAMKAGKPTAAKEVKKEDKDKSFLQKIFGFLAGPIGVLVSIFSSVIGTLTGGLKKLSEVIGSILSLASTAGLIKTATDVAKGAVGVGRGLAAAAAGTGALVANAAGKVFGGSKSPSGGIATKGKPLTDFGTAGRSREAVKNKSLWARFLAFVERKSPKLFARVFAKLAAAGGLAAIPGPGWILSAVELGLAAWTMYELYELWKEFNGLPSEQNALSPEQMENLDSSGALDDAALGKNIDTTPKETSTTPARTPSLNPMIEAARKAAENRTTPVGRGNSTPESSKETPSYGNVTFNKLSKEQQDIVLDTQYKKEGNNPGDIAYDLKNPGAMIYGDFAKKFGAKPNMTRGTLKYPDGSLRPFAEFPTFEAGREAQRALWSSKFGNTPLSKALREWVVPRNAAEENQLANYTAGIYKALGEPTPPSQTQMASQATPEAQPASSSSLTSSASNNEYDPERIKAIANYRVGIPPKLTADGKGAGITVNNVDSSKKVVQGGSGSSMSAGKVYNDDMAILLLDRTIADRMFG
jgi:hypothetical protein